MAGIVKGYAYRCESPDNWRACSDEHWRTEVVKSMPKAHFVGYRTIDGVRCTVWDYQRMVYAQSATYAKAPKGVDGPYVPGSAPARASGSRSPKASHSVGPKLLRMGK